MSKHIGPASRRTRKFLSATFRNIRNLRVWLPPGYNDPGNVTKKYPVLYILDGKSAFDACKGSFTTKCTPMRR